MPSITLYWRFSTIVPYVPLVTSASGASSAAGSTSGATASRTSVPTSDRSGAAGPPSASASRSAITAPVSGPTTRTSVPNSCSPSIGTITIERARSGASRASSVTAVTRTTRRHAAVSANASAAVGDRPCENTTSTSSGAGIGGARNVESGTVVASRPPRRSSCARSAAWAAELPTPVATTRRIGRVPSDSVGSDRPAVRARASGASRRRAERIA